MPGIAGILTKNVTGTEPQLLETMVDSMYHEAFYTKASHIDKKHGWFCVSVGISGSYEDCMPIFNEARNIVLFLSGECYTDPQVITGLKSKGHAIVSSGADHIVHLYEEEGLDFLSKLNGWFSGIILDTRKANAFLFNDRYGMRKIYYHENNNAFYFASEAKALFKVIPSLKNPEMKSIAEYLSFDCVLEDRTYFSGVNLLPGGSLWEFNGRSIRRKSHSDMSRLEGKIPMNLDDFLDRLTTTFERILPRYLVGEKLAVSLTGGLDTRLIMSCIPFESHQILAVTFGGMYRDSMDLRLAREVSKACNIEHHTIYLDKTFLSDYPQHAERAVYMTDGLVESTNIDLVYLNSCFRKLAPIKLMGTYGTQVLSRVRRGLRYRPPSPNLISEEFRSLVETVSETLVPFENEHNLTYLCKREIPWYWSKFLAPQISQLTIRSPFLDNDFVDLLYSVPKEGFDGTQFEIDAISKFRKELLDIRTNKGVKGTHPNFANSFIKLFYSTRALADKSVHWPLLPYSLQHIVTKVDSHILSPLRINKLYYGHEYWRHYTAWFRKELAPYLMDVLLDNKTLSRPYWNGKFIKKMVKDHVKGNRRYISEINKVLTLELVHRNLLEKDV